MVRVSDRHRRWCRVPMRDARLVHVTARLRSSVVWTAQFPAPLDGILAAAARRRTLGANYGVVDDRHTDTLPLASTCRERTQHGRFADKRWSWAASCAWWEPDTATEEVLHLHRRAWNPIHAERVGITPEATPANTDIGRWKPWRVPMVATVALDVHWWCLGDPDGIEDLLGDITHLGKKKAHGRGEVHAWTVEDLGDPTWDRVMWFPDGRISRPLDVRNATALGLTDPPTTLWLATRPPYWRAMPTPTSGRFTRQPREVIAPTVTRPDHTDPTTERR